MRTTLWGLLLFVSICSMSFAQSRIQTRGGGIYEGHIVSDSGEFILLTTSDSAEVRVAKSEIVIEEHNINLTNTKGKSFPLIGISFGTPAGIQLIGGYYFGDVGTRISFGYLGKSLGMQLNLFHNISRSISFSQNVGIALGYFNSPGDAYPLNSDRSFFTARTSDRWAYIAALYDINWRGFFSEIGFSLGDGSFQSPQFMLQLGYVYEFRF